MTIKMSTRSTEATDLVTKILAMTIEDASSEHGLEFYKGGRVYDTIEDIEYSSLLMWAEAQISVIYGTKFQKRSSRNSLTD